PVTGKARMPSWKLHWSKVSSSMTNVPLKKTVTGNVIKREFSINNGSILEYKNLQHVEVFISLTKLDHLSAPVSKQDLHQTIQQFLNPLQVAARLPLSCATGSSTPQSSTYDSDQSRHDLSASRANRSTTYPAASQTG